MPLSPFGSTKVSACSVFCGDSSQRLTKLQARWLRELVDRFRATLPHVHPVVVLFCAAAQPVLEHEFGRGSPVLQPLPSTWSSDFDRSRLSKLLLSVEFWEMVEGDKVLIFQPDGWLCPDAERHLIQFLPYDYVGAPWARSSPPVCELLVGNGGFSLRDRRAALRVLRDARTPLILKQNFNVNEDLMWCRIFAELRGHVPSPDAAAHFSVENYDPGVTYLVGAHDCSFVPTLRLEAACPGITHKMAAVRLTKPNFIWAIPWIALAGSSPPVP